MIEIEYNLILVELTGKNRETLDISEPIPLAQLETKLGLTDDDVGMLLINGVWAPLDSVIKDGDFVQLYPNLEGG
jgi:molybdopterin converting factor small subunit